MQTLLRASKLSRSDHGRARLQELDLALHPGQVLGLLGLNGAGKSTALSILAGALPPSSGDYQLAGGSPYRDPALRNRIGWLPQHCPAYPELSVVENLRLFGRLRGLKAGPLASAVDEQLQRRGLTDLRERMVNRLSRGQQQRLGLALALLHAPDLLLLDEPTAGLDPVEAARLRTDVQALSEGRVVILATHLLPDLAQCVTDLLVLEQGRTIATHAMAELAPHELEATLLGLLGGAAA